MKLTLEQKSEIIPEMTSSKAGFNELMRVLWIAQNATRLISRKTPEHRQRYSSPKSTPFSLLLPQCTERAQRVRVARASAVFGFLPSLVKAEKGQFLHPQVTNYQ